VVFALLAIDVWRMGDPARMADLPREWWTAMGFLRWLPSSLDAVLFDPQVLRALRWSALALAVAAAAGVRPYPLLAASFCAVYLLLRGLASGFLGFINHGWLALALFAVMLAAFPAAEAFALRRSSPKRQRVELYVAPIVAMGAVFCTCYFLLGLRRFAHGGLAIFTNDALPTYLAVAALKDGADGGFEYGVAALASPLAAVVLKVGYFVVTLMELLAPLCVASTAFRLLWLGVMIPFHVSTLFTMNILFENNLVLMLLLLTPLPRWLASKLRREQ
jgi:hypothetical protein